MAFRRRSSSDFVLLDEPDDSRPVLIYVTAPISSKDFSYQTSSYRHFQRLPFLPNSVLKRDAKPYNLCLIEVNPHMEKVKEQICSVFYEYEKAAHKVVIINAHGTPEGVILKDRDRDSAGVILNGEHLAEFLSPHTHGHHIHVFVFSAHGHTFAQQFYSYLHEGTPTGASDTVAISYFTSKNKPTAWDMVATVGKGNVVVTQKLREFVKSIIAPNNPYRTLDNKIKP